MMVAWMLTEMLEELGYFVLGPATSVGEALTIIETKAIDAVVLDLNLNGEMSYPVADSLTARGVPFMLSTAYRQDRLPDAYRTLPILQKPYHLSELAEKLRQLLAAHADSSQWERQVN